MNESEMSFEEAVKSLPRELEPGRDLWPGVEHAIARPQKPIYKQPASIVAASVALLAVFMFARAPVSTQTPTLVQNTENIESIALTLSEGFEQDKQLLLQHYANQPSFTPDWQVQLQEMDESKELILKALADDPNNATLLRLLQQVYKEQLSLIQKVHPSTRYTSI